MSEQEKHAARTRKRVAERQRKREVDEKCSTECAAFSVTPEEGFKHGGDHSILFDHTLISGSDKTSGINFRCGNIMALSAPSKGLPQEGGDGAKYMSFFLEHGEDITKAWFDKVNEQLKQFYGQNEYINAANNYENIDNLNLPKEGQVTKVTEEEYQQLHEMLAEDLPDFLVQNVFGIDDWKKLKFDSAEETKIKNTLQNYFNGEETKLKKVYYTKGRLDKAYQLLFYNDLWQTQKFGGFDAGKVGPYGVFYEGLVDGDRKMKGKAAEKLKEFIEQSIKGVDVLFLCESVHHLDQILGDDYTCVSIKKTEDEIYSAICKKDSGIEIVQGTAEGNAEYGIFTINKGEHSIKVAVVHTKEKVKKEEKKLVGPLEKDWIAFVKELGDVNYMVGDTNMTAKKSKLTDNGDGSKKAFWESMGRVNEAVVPTRPIKKVRLGNSVESKVNGFLNNQINKGGKKESEVDGMVILKLSGGGKSETGGGRKRRRRKTKKKRKSKRKSKRKRKPKRKTKRKRKRRRTKKR